ncbi:sigma 54-interacting transcriptional regulator [Vandammella animalimorsus]|uniref:sigma 54-interacting transcriptional regulator n=1 Tax=Vandammella animalimorsus TaxID=2029117 RepID=UPI001EED83D0|nr:sigma 54-interacting transcriptional regulator [Vandammella animalimorsus]
MPEKNASILVIDDEPDLRLLYELTLMREGYQVESAETVAQAREKLQRHFDVVLTDMRLPDGLGMEILLELQAAGRPERCIVVTAYGSAENAVEALRAGAFDYLAKPVELKQLRTVVASAVQGLPGKPSSLEASAADHTAAAAPAAQPAPGAVEPECDAAEPEQTGSPPQAAGARTAAPAAAASSPKKRKTPAKQEADDDPGAAALANLVGQSPIMQAVKERIGKVARSMAPVHIHGESGTGKELVARALHANSQRASGPLVAVNCGAIPENLLEAEFFGAKKGSYTGATHDRPGFFQAAKGGTLFLDEIGDLPLAMQTKLLRAIQERSVRPLGATQEEVVDVRLVSATHRDLAQEVEQGRFRQDLYYRLNVIEVRIPPLRERREDLPALVEALLARLARDSGFEHVEASPAFMAAVLRRPFPGNVRELENLLHRAMALSEDGILRPEYIDDAGNPARASAATAPQAAPDHAPNHTPAGAAPLAAPAAAPAAMPAVPAALAPAATPAVAPAPPVAEPPPAPPPASFHTGAAPWMQYQAQFAMPSLGLPAGSGAAPSPAPAPKASPAPAAHASNASAGGATVEPLPSDLQAWLDEQERAVLIRALQAARYNRTAAAAMLGLNLRQIRYRIERLNIPTEPDARA